MRSKYRPGRCNHTSLHSHDAFLFLAWGFSLKMTCLTYRLLFMYHRLFECAVSCPLWVLIQEYVKPVSIYKPSLTRKVTFLYRKWSAFHMLWLVTYQLEYTRIVRRENTS